MGERVRGFKVRVGWEFCISKRGGGQIEQWRYTSWRSPRRKSQYCPKKSRYQERGVASEVRAAQSSKFEKESSEHFRWIHLEQVQH